MKSFSHFGCQNCERKSVFACLSYFIGYSIWRRPVSRRGGSKSVFRFQYFVLGTSYVSSFSFVDVKQAFMSRAEAFWNVAPCWLVNTCNWGAAGCDRNVGKSVPYCTASHPNIFSLYPHRSDNPKCRISVLWPIALQIVGNSTCDNVRKAWWLW
jgi:hypothetical protein